MNIHCELTLKKDCVPTDLNYVVPGPWRGKCRKPLRLVMLRWRQVAAAVCRHGPCQLLQEGGAKTGQHGNKIKGGGGRGEGKGRGVIWGGPSTDARVSRASGAHVRVVRGDAAAAAAAADCRPARRASPAPRRRARGTFTKARP